MRKKLVKRKEYPLVIENAIGIVVSSVIGLIVTFVLSFLISLFLYNSLNLPENLHFYLASAIILGAFTNGFVSSFKCKLKGLVSGLIASIPFCLFLIIALLSFSNGQITSNTGFLYALIFIFSTLGGILGANTKRRK